MMLLERICLFLAILSDLVGDREQDNGRLLYAERRQDYKRAYKRHPGGWKHVIAPCTSPL